MLQIHFSNRYELLAGQLAMRLAAPADDPFATDEVIVPSIALQRALTLEIARARGICVNVRFAYLAPWLWQQLGRLLAGDPAAAALDPAVLAWRIDGVHRAAEFTGAHPRLAAWLANADDVMRHALAVQVAGLFDHYHTYRPDWIDAWQHGRAAGTGAVTDAERADERWQAALWQRLAAVGAVPPPPDFDALDAALARATQSQSAAAGIPATVHVFALPALPPLHLELLARLARAVEIHLYVLNPCREYWFELIDRRRLAWLALRARADQHEEGNRLLAAWGRQAQACIDLLVDRCGDGATDDAQFQPHGGATLLARLQDAILDLHELAPASLPHDVSDRSIEMHVCHSRTRELEVLHDRLLGLLASGEVQHPGEIVVATPDLDAAAPLIEAVFGTAPPERRIPFSITGRARSRADAAAAALLALLAAVTSRCGASEVFALLQLPIVARRAGLDDDALARVHDGLEASGVRWGLDGAHRAAFGVPPTDDHSWADGLERLFLGYALPDAVAQPFAGLLPAGAAEGSDALALGALWRFVEWLRALRDECAVPCGAQAWRERLHRVVDEGLDPADDEIDAVVELKAAIGELTQTMQRAGLDDPGTAGVPLAVVRDALAQQLDDPARGGVPGGGVTFTSMSSLRSLPYPVVAVIGLDDGAFPSARRSAEFDLMALRARRGDRQRRIDERNLFLDLLLAARRVLHLSWVGRSVRDNAPLPSSVLVAELLDTLAAATANDPASAASLAAARRRLVVEHPLQPFAIEAFRTDADARLRSHDRELAAALRASLATPHAPSAAQTSSSDADDEAGDDDGAAEPQPPFFAAPLAAPDAAWHQVSDRQLLDFLRQPCRYLLGRRMGIEFARIDEPLVDDEPFTADAAARRALADRLLPALLAGADDASLRHLAAAGGDLPAGAIGAGLLEIELATLRGFGARLRPLVTAACLDPATIALDFELDGQAWHLACSFADLRPEGLARWRAGALNARDVLEAWLAHLVRSAAPPQGAATVTTWVALDRTLRFAAPAADARDRLAELLRLYRRGLAEPVEFFPRAAWTLVETGSLHRARAVWAPSDDRAYAEGADPAYRLALRGRGDALAGEFESLAHAVFDPALAAAQFA